MTAEFSCPCGTRAAIAADDSTDQTVTFDATVRRHFTGDHS